MAKARTETATSYPEILDHAGLGLVTADLTGRVITANRALCRMLACDEADLQGVELLALAHSAGAPTDDALLADLLAGRQERLRIERRFVRRDGGALWARATISISRDAAGNPESLVGVFEDVTERRTTEMALGVGQGHLGLLAHQLPAVLWAVDLDLRFTSSIGGGLAALGLRPGEVVGLSLFDFFRTEDPAFPPIAAHLGALAGERTSYDLAWEDCVYRSHVAPLHDELGRVAGAIGLALDVTAQRRAEDALRESEQQFRQLADAIRQVFWLVDMKTGNMIYVSPAYREIWGRPEEHLYRDPSAWLETLHPDDRERAQRSHEDVRTAGQYAVEYRIVRPDGTERWVRDRGFAIRDEEDLVVRVAGLAEDITERRQAQEALQASEEMRRSITESSPDHIMMVDLDGRVLFVNRPMPGVVADPAGGTPVFECVPERFHGGMHACFDGVCRTGEAGSFEMEYAGADGKVLSFVSRVCPVRRGGVVVGLTIQSTDVTTQKLLQDQLYHAQKMESIGRLAGGIAHDLNNQLSVVMGSIELARRHLEEGSAVGAELHRIQTAGERAAALTRQLLAFSRKQVLKPRRLSLNTLLAGVQEMLRRVIGEDVRLRLELGRVGQVRVDPVQLEQVVLNLAINARDAMPDGGQLVVTTSEVALPDRTTGLPPGRYALLTVSDTGTGMSHDTLDRVFEPFFTTKEVGKGTGLGLAVVHGIVTQSGGHIGVMSTPGKGSTFRIHLPVNEGDEESERRAAVAAARGSETILLVEDERMVLEVTRRILEAHGYRVLTASGGSEALARLEGHTGDVHLLLADVVMPGMDGQELARRALALRPALKVIFLSGYAPDVVRRSEGARYPFLQKPATPAVIAHTVRRVLDRPPGS